MRRSRAPAAGVLFAGLFLNLLAGCAMSDDTMSGMIVAPGKYTLYSCDALAEAHKKAAAEERELRQLMARADADSAGRLVSAVAYQTDYLTVRGELNELHQASIDKKCGLVTDDDDRVSDAIIR
jgi:hypothetical protein